MFPPETATPTRVFAVDDHPGFLRVIEPVVAASPGFELVGTASCGLDALAALAADPLIELVLLDMYLPDITGLDVAQRYADGPGTASIVLMSTASLDDLPTEARAGCVAGFMPKESLSTSELQRMWNLARAASSD